jgi:hypothetical protein
MTFSRPFNSGNFHSMAWNLILIVSSEHDKKMKGNASGKEIMTVSNLLCYWQDNPRVDSLMQQY